MITKLLLSTAILCPLAPALQKAPEPGEDQKPKRITVLEVPSYPVLRTDREISIDGSLAEWPNSVPALLVDDPRQLSGTAHQAWRGAHDLAARGALLWDEENLYISLHVRDEWPRALPKETPLAAPMFPPCDHLELHFDPKRDTRAAGADPGRAEDISYVFGLLTDKRPFSIAWRRVRATTVQDSRRRGAMVYDVRKSTWTIEASIPWSELLGADQTPKQGLAIDANFVFSDYDEPTDILAQTRIGWTFGSHPTRIDPAMYGTLILTGGRYDSTSPPARPRLPKTTGIDQPESKTFERWIDTLRRLKAQPGIAGLEGERGRILSQLDAELERYPIADTQQLLVLMQRRMQREMAGYLERGAPSALKHAMLTMLKEMPEKYEADAPTIRALPGRGFLLRSKEGSVALDPGFPLVERLAGGLDAVCYSRAFDPMDRSDPLSLRVFARKRSVLAHTGFHLHGYGPFHEHAVQPGDEGELPGKIRVRALGSKGDDGSVTPTIGWQVTWPNGFVVVDAALSALPDQVQLPEGKERVDVLVLDPKHPARDAWIEKARPVDVLLAGFLDLPRFRTGSLRQNHRIAEARDACRALEKQGARVWLLAPGQAWQVPE